MPARGGMHETDSWLLNLPPTSKQRWAALAVAACILGGFGIVAPFASTPLPPIIPLVPSITATISVTNLITSILLFAHFSIYRSRALLVLASGYLFVALIVIPNALTVPGAFSPTGLLGAGPQSAGWLYCFWHTGFAAALLSYVWFKEEKQATHLMHTSAFAAVVWTVTIVLGLVCGLTWFATGGENLLPRLFQDRVQLTPAALYILISISLFCAIAIAVLWARRRSVLDQWLLIVALSLFSELVFVILGAGRFTLGSYANRAFSLVTSTIVLAVLFAETTKLYARLARSNVMLRREQNSKLMNLEAMAASISHEVRQPLAAIVSNGSAALRFLDRAPPNLEEVRSALTRLLRDSHRVEQVFDSLRALFGKSGHGHELINANEVALEALRIFRDELRNHRIIARTHLTSELLPIMGNRGQLQEVIINLIQNAIQAMDGVKVDRRVLQVKTQLDGDSIALIVEDSGPGIDPTKMNSIFDPFVTTKRDGMGLGLAICQTIVERHAGKMFVVPADPHGCVFKVVLPIGTPDLPKTEGELERSPGE
jgi:signal transduction histidine kinase